MLYNGVQFLGCIPPGELSLKEPERGKAVCRLFALSVLAMLGHLSQRERQGVLAYIIN